MAKEKAAQKGGVESRQITLRMKTNLWDELNQIAKAMGLTVTAVLILASWLHVLGPISQRQ